MPKLTFTSSLLCLTAAAVFLPVGCASGAGTNAVGSTSSALASDGGAAGSLVISQVFGGGTSSGVLNQDYVELFNPTRAAISLGGLSLQFGSATSNFGDVGEVGSNAVFPLSASVSVPPGGYYLVGLHKEPGGTSLSKAPDAQVELDLLATDGKVILATGTDPVECGGQTNCTPADYLDLVGYGSASQAEGVRLAGLDAGKSAQRKGTPAGCTDTNNNANDFVALPPPSPARNASTTPTPCPATTGPKDAGSDGAKPVGVTDPDLPDDDGSGDSGVKTDAGKSNVSAAADDSGCSVGGVGAANLSAMGLLFVAGVAVTARRRRRGK